MRLNPYRNSVQEYIDRYGRGWLKEFKLDKKAQYDTKVYKNLYYKEVWSITEDNKSLISEIEKRGYYTYHIDHKIPISEGYRLSIPPDIIAHPSNLRMLPARENMSKRNQRYVDESNRWIEEKYMSE